MFLSFISIYYGFTSNDKTIVGLGLFALSFWVSWFDPNNKGYLYEGREFFKNL